MAFHFFMAALKFYHLFSFPMTNSFGVYIPSQFLKSQDR